MSAALSVALTATRGLALRMRVLNSVLMSIVGDDADDADALEERVYGEAFRGGQVKSLSELT